MPGEICATILTTQRPRLRCLSGHIPHHATFTETCDILAHWGSKIGSEKLLIGMDANEVFSQPFTIATNSQTGRGERILQWLTEHNITLPRQDCHVPTHFPDNTALNPRRLDYVATREIAHSQGEWCPQSQSRI